jgi:membrane-associated phospholipid phosphatase
MGLLTVVAEVVTAVALLLTTTAVVVVGPARLRRLRRSLRQRILASSGPILLLGVVLLLNALVRDVGLELSWLVGVNVTGLIYAVEGEFVAWLQRLGSPVVTTVLGYVYVYGYAFLVTFPLVAYLAHEDQRYLRATATAYVVNYSVGLVCYVLFIAYGPRNYMPDVVHSLLYDALPRFQLLTSQINTNTNVFPSLHTSLSATVALLAVRTRNVYPRWPPVAVVLAASVALATMYLGIHWATDVVAGLVLAGASVAIAARMYSI